MEAYTSFARVYDLFMDNIPYGEWCGYVAGLLKKRGVDGGLVLDLGCGTGSLTELLAAAGYDMIGVDNSEEMLEIALEKKLESGRDILYLLQDMREFELYGTVAAVVSICDSINYILEYEELVEVFRLVNNYLDPGGVFVFDLNTEYKYRQLLGESTIAENRDEGSFIWENFYDEESRINEYGLTLFIRADGAGGKGRPLFERYEETHYQKAYSIEEICRALKEAGLILEACYDAFTEDAPREDSERIYFVAREHGKRQEGERDV